MKITKTELVAKKKTVTFSIQYLAFAGLKGSTVYSAIFRSVPFFIFAKEHSKETEPDMKL